MTLARQTIIIAIFALILIFMSTLTIAVQNTRAYFTEQLGINAVDTSTSLGLTISSKIQSLDDKTVILSIINAAFDRGHFKSISMRDNDGELVASRYIDKLSVSVPKWFVRLVPMETKSESALIMQGWRQLGTVNVESDSCVAYQALWNTAQELFVFFLAATLSIIMLTVWLMRVTFRPLTSITKQAEDIGKKNLYVLPKVPRLIELKILTETMNAMVLKLKEYFASQIKEVEKLRLEVYQDPLTGNGNRKYFFSVFNQYLSDEKTFLPGYLCLLKINGLIEYNKQHGYQAGDQLLRDVSAILDTVFAHKYRLVLARLDNPSFAVILLDQDNSNLEDTCREVCLHVDNLLSNLDAAPVVVGLGVVKCNFGDTASNLLAIADSHTTIESAAKRCKFSIESRSEDAKSSENWRSKVTKAIEDKNFYFYIQPIKGIEYEHHNECFIKLLNDDGKEISAAYFFPIVDEFGLGGSIDRLVVQEIIKYLPSGMVSLNLTRMTILNESEQDKFVEVLQGLHLKTDLKLCFEFGEGILDENTPIAKQFIYKLQALGFAVGLDKVGIILTPLSYLSEVNLAYLKLDASFTKHIEKNKEHREMIAKWVNLVDTLDLVLIATAVETEEQWSCLRNLGVNHFQGNYIQSPQVMSSKD